MILNDVEYKIIPFNGLYLEIPTGKHYPPLFVGDAMKLIVESNQPLSMEQIKTMVGETVRFDYNPIDYHWFVANHRFVERSKN